ncbi:MAG: disulfide oxidoreductase, partial [Stellaceae bacterium]
ITQRFVDRRSAFLVRRLASEDTLSASVSAAGEVRVEGAYVGRLDGLRFVADAIDGIEMRTLTAAANRVLRGEVAARARQLAADADAAFTIDAAGMVRWRRGIVGRMTAGERMLTPRAEPFAGDFIEGEAREKIRQRLSAYIRAEVERRLAPLLAICALPLGGVGRGLAFQLAEALGALPSAEVAPQAAALDRADRAALSRHGVRFGTETIYVEPLLRPEALRFRGLLWAVWHGREAPRLPPARRLAKTIDIDPALPLSFYAALGFFAADRLAMRPDRLERLAAAARRLARQGRFAADDQLASIAGVEPGGLRPLLTALGYRAVIDAGAESFVARPRRHRDIAARSRQVPVPREDHPFAELHKLKLA